jgi:hypothetical protein
MRWIPVCVVLLAPAAFAQPAVKVVSGGKTTPLSEEGKTQKYYPLNPSQTFRFEASGPRRLSLLLRAKLDLSAPVSTFALEIARDVQNRMAQALDLSPEVEDGRRQKMQTYIAPARKIAVDVPAGLHAFEVRLALGEAYARVVEEKEEPPEDDLALAPLDTPPDLATIEPEPEIAPIGAPPPAKTAAAEPPARTEPAAFRTIEARADEAKKEPAPEIAAAEKPSAAREPRFRIQPTLGFGFTLEGELRENTPAFHLGGAFEWWFRNDLVFGARVAAELYGRNYLLNRIDAGGAGIASVELDEQKIDADLFASYEVLHWLAPRLPPFFQRFGVWVEGGPSARFFVNELLPSNFFGVQVGGRATFRINDQLQLEAAAGHIYNWFPDLGSLSFFGSPRAATVMRGALAIAFPPGTRLRLGYGGEIYAQEFSYRSYHALSFLFDVAF